MKIQNAIVNIKSPELFALIYPDGTLYCDLCCVGGVSLDYFYNKGV